MAYEVRDGQGSLFKNDKKDTEQQPDYRGSIRINGQDYWLSAWIKSSKAGVKYMSLSAQPKQERPAASSGRMVVKEENPLNDDVPW